MRGVTERGPVINQRASSNPELGEYKESVGFCPQVFHVFLAVSPRFCLVLYPRGRRGGKVGSAGDELEDNDGWYIGLMFRMVLMLAHLVVLDKELLNGCCCCHIIHTYIHTIDL